MDERYGMKCKNKQTPGLRTNNDYQECKFIDNKTGRKLATISAGTIANQRKISITTDETVEVL